MSDVFYLRPIDGPIGPSDVHDMAAEAGGCFNIHRVDWEQSYLAADGNRMMSRYIPITAVGRTSPMGPFPRTAAPISAYIPRSATIDCG